MTKILVPEHLQDDTSSLSTGGFQVANTWFHGTSSGLIEHIQASGLVRSGDVAIAQMTEKAMKTIGVDYTSRTEPVFLSPTKELAFFWASEKAAVRSRRLGQEEQPVVLELKLPEILKSKVRPDVGAAPMLMLGDHPYLDFLKHYYEAREQELDLTDASGSNRERFLISLGLAYLDEDIPVECVSVL